MNNLGQQKEITRAYCKSASEELMRVVPLLTNEDFYLAGGCIRSTLLSEEVKDIDVFLRKETLIQPLLDQCVGFKSANAISINSGGFNFQIIITVTGAPLEIVNEFDFTMNSNYYLPNYDLVHVGDPTSLMLKLLVVNINCRNKLGTLGRLLKFLGRDYKIADRNTILQLGVALTHLNPIFTFEELERESKLYFSEDQFNNIDFVSKPQDDVDDGFIVEGYKQTLSGKSGTLGSGL